MVWALDDFTVLCRVICRVGVDSVQYGVGNIYAVCDMPWATYVYTVGNMGYGVGIWCGYIF